MRQSKGGLWDHLSIGDHHPDCTIYRKHEGLTFCAWRLPIARAALRKCRLRKDTQFNPYRIDQQWNVPTAMFETEFGEDPL